MNHAKIIGMLKITVVWKKKLKGIQNSVLIVSQLKKYDHHKQWKFEISVKEFLSYVVSVRMKIAQIW